MSDQKSAASFDLPPKYDNMPICTQNMVKQYLSELNIKEYSAYLIAIKTLGDSFDIIKSIGFNEWKKTQSIS